MQFYVLCLNLFKMLFPSPLYFWPPDFSKAPWSKNVWAWNFVIFPKNEVTTGHSPRKWNLTLTFPCIWPNLLERNPKRRTFPLDYSLIHLLWRKLYPGYGWYLNRGCTPATFSRSKAFVWNSTQTAISTSLSGFSQFWTFQIQNPILLRLRSPLLWSIWATLAGHVS